MNTSPDVSPAPWPAAQVLTTLAVYLRDRQAEAEHLHPRFAAAARVLEEFVLGGGKRIRPTFAWWGWRGAGGDMRGPDADAVLRAVSALELLQACALVHDDLIDDSVVRRGSPTVHETFAAEHTARGWRGDAGRFGAAAAVLLGDVALAWADDMFADAGLSSEALARAREPWRTMRTEMLAGQYLDAASQAAEDESAETAIRIDQLKTAAYTVAGPLHFGAAIAGTDPDLVAGYRAFGADIGVAFQLRDDLLGVFGDPAVTGKPAGDDLREGKRTLLLALGLGKADHDHRAADAATLRAAIGRADLGVPELTEVRRLLVDLGALDAVEARISELTASALATLESCHVAEPASAQLASLAITATQRSS
ncbi:MAG: polyprenyl synthetase family protein [Sciscionella sp.]